MSQQPTYYRIRITFGKVDDLRFIGHLDLAKTWERVLRRAEIPLVYSQGFNPQPKMQLASALPLGISSSCELLDIWMQEELPLDSLPDRLRAVSPAGLRVYTVSYVPAKSPALQTLLASAEYRIVIDEVGDDELGQRIEALLSQTEIMTERRGKPYDFRPRLLDLQHPEPGVMVAHLTLGERGTARPDDLLGLMGLSFNLARCHRQALHLVAPED